MNSYINNKIIREKLSNLNGKTILITGANGMLGSALADILAWNLSDANIIALNHDQLDVTDRNSVLKFSFGPIDLILHCAAKVDAEYCEINPKICRDVIIDGTRNLIDLAKLTKAKIFYPQSFLIFDGQDLPIAEETKPSPLCVYGRCKLEAERLIIKRLPNHLIVRLAGFFGGYQKDKNFVGKFIPHLAKIMNENKTFQEVGDRVWQPTYTYDLAYNCLVLLAEGKKGIYNMAGQGECSFYELACEIVKCLGISNRIKIIKVSADKFARKESAKRPLKATIVNKRLRDEGLDLQRFWQESLKEYLNHEYFKKLF